MKNPELRLFGITLIVIFGVSEAFLAHNTYYTQGEFTQLLYCLLISLNLPLIGMTLWRPRVGLWCASALAGLLLPWQGFQNIKWAMLQEEVVGIMHFVELKKKHDGHYPDELSGYEFQQDWTAANISFSHEDENYRISYFMSQPGIAYTYDSSSGFGYYGD
jgi:hypothetical protein